ncbi:HAMP domain-containing histidine kinase [Crossiella sp. SN42]|uniref:sensor histidine kinase n=1 Tax=Crossiella sp. SN42 TaxID=2944808 RepID=UPI00207C1432|nr:HAMP domain-containing sensor histidine kinase [Crossiella sp. SN42]MCO1574918.1 HAMP domain-containing histidine kinase [Crossiella sp. SN42]
MAAVSLLLLWLGWMLVGGVVDQYPVFPPDTRIKVLGQELPPSQVHQILKENAREVVLNSGAIAFVCMVLATAILAWTLTGRVLRPLHEVTHTAHRLSVESLDERIALRGPRDEVAELADTFDAMLDRLQAAFESQRRFVANASHELRTPLAVVRTELDVTLADPDADAAELRRMAGVVRTATQRAEHLVEALLLLARTDAVGLSARESVDLSALVRSAWSAARAAAEERGLRTEFHTPAVQAVGDPVLLERLAGNLLENAVRHNVDGGWITVRTEADAKRATLRVVSSGGQISVERVAELFEPFRRGGTDRTAHRGAGLGLSIVRSVVGAHGGEVSAEPVPGGGLDVTVTLPIAP